MQKAPLSCSDYGSDLKFSGWDYSQDDGRNYSITLTEYLPTKFRDAQWTSLALTGTAVPVNAFESLTEPFSKHSIFFLFLNPKAGFSF